MKIFRDIKLAIELFRYMQSPLNIMEMLQCKVNFIHHPSHGVSLVQVTFIGATDDYGNEVCCKSLTTLENAEKMADAILEEINNYRLNFPERCNKIEDDHLNYTP